MAILLATRFDAGDWAAWWPALQQAFPGERLLRDRAEATPGETIEIALVANPPHGALADLPGLRLVQSLWAGVDKLLADPTVPRHVPLCRMVDPAMNEAMAETALWAVLSLHRDHFAYARAQRDGIWQPKPQRRADEIRVAVLGLGQMGRTCAHRLARNGYTVTGWSTRSAELDGVTAHAGAAALPAVLAQAEIVVNLLPLTDATRGLFGASTFALLPRGAALVNLARGGHVVEADLLAALATGQLAHAVLDVFDTEPLPGTHAFWRHPAITVLPHVAAQTDPRSAAAIAARNVRALREGRPLENLVDRSRGY
ncbi:MAG TPA: glyoxylate/hydroxypyruvate reductase A [Burkholderiaceae bacterium]|nr:glyoxylate/hydroxypyruvate reductase A [Burkholderiaceae bacterium]